MAVRKPGRGCRFSIRHSVDRVGEDGKGHGHGDAAGEVAEDPAGHDEGKGITGADSGEEDELSDRHAEEAEHPDVAFGGFFAEPGKEEDGDEPRRVEMASIVAAMEVRRSWF